VKAGKAAPEEMGALLQARDAWEAQNWRLPLTNQMPALHQASPFYFDWLAHPDDDAYWQHFPQASYEQTRVPALNLGGWFDIFLRATLANYQGMKQRGGSPVARKHTRLVIGPWSHEYFTGLFPDFSYGLQASADVLCYTTAPQEKPLEVIGPIELVLFVSSSALDTDFTGKLVDVFPDGRAELLTDGILRARYRGSLVTPELLEPNRVYELHLDLGATANVFLAGHRLRLEVSSSNSPRFDRNTNTGGVIAQEGEDSLIPATNRVFHDQQHPSHVLLPIIER